MYTTKGEHPKKNSKEENEMENYNYSIFTNEEVAEFLTWAETEEEKEAISYLLYHYEEEIEKVELLDNFDFKGTKEWDEWMLRSLQKRNKGILQKRIKAVANRLQHLFQEKLKTPLRGLFLAEVSVYSISY